MTEALPDPTIPKAPEAEHRPKLRGYLLAVVTFFAGILGTLFTQAFVGHQQLLHAKRETRVAVLRDYVAACNSDAIQFSELANLPLHFRAIWDETSLTPNQRREQILKMNWESIQHQHKTAIDLAVQAEVVNALFETKVDPIRIVMKDVPPEFRALPGETEPDKWMERFKGDPLAMLNKYAPVLGRQSVVLSNYCRDSVQELSREID
jgi:hypothetical protein